MVAEIRGSYNEYNHKNLCLWQLSDYNRIIFIDFEIILLRNSEDLQTALSAYRVFRTMRLEVSDRGVSGVESVIRRVE